MLRTSIPWATDVWTGGHAQVVVEDGGAVAVQRAGSADERLRCVVAAFWRLRDDGLRAPGRDDRAMGPDHGAGDGSTGDGQMSGRESAEDGPA